MEPVLLRKVQLIQLEILKEIDSICKKNNITYFLIGGSAIGAVRHKGFIPWDDDIDLGMLRRDYQKFIKVCQKELDKKYFLQTNETDILYPNYYAKVRKNNTTFIEEGTRALEDSIHQGIFVDIFPLDNISDQKIVATLHFKLVHLFISISSTYAKNYPKSKLRKYLKFIFAKSILLIFNKKILDKMAYKISTRLIEKKTYSVINFFGRHGLKEMVPKYYYNNGVLMEFEKQEFPIPENWERFLTHIYGDFMRVPNEAQREIHSVTNVDLEKSYENYFK